MDTFLDNHVIKADMREIEKSFPMWNRLNDTTLLITGAYGMLASYLVYFLIHLNEKYKDFNVQILAQGRSIEAMRKRFGTYVDKDYFKICSFDICKEISCESDIDYIIHAASFASPQYYGVCPVDVLSPNVIGNYHLLNLAKEKKTTGFLLFSSGDIYGILNKNIVCEDDFGGMNTLDIHSCYSESKRMAETMCKSFFVQYGVPIKIARIWHTYAPTMNIEKDPRVFSSFMKNIVNNQNIELKSDGTGKRCFCYITDAVSAYFRILLLGKAGEAYNVCNSSQYISMAELADKLVSLADNNNLCVVKKKREKDEQYIENNLLFNRERIPSNQKLKSLGWEEKIDIREGFNRVLQYLKSI